MTTFLGNLFTKKSQNDSSFSFKVLDSDEYENLNKIASKMMITSKKITSFEKYQHEIDKIFSQLDSKLTELDFRYTQKSLQKSSSLPKKPKDIDKMKFIGKIGNSPTTLDPSSFYGGCIVTFGGRKVESMNDFLSGHTNNCVTSGKWCYEVQLISNGLFQLGWCQLVTPFTSNEGVGDDPTSFAFDGWRRVIWNGNKTKYGELWDCGEYIGCCIDIEEKKIEFFLNGKNLGTAFVNVPFGKNVAFFPGMSMTRREKCIFNFGQLPFKYKYNGYEPLDIPLCEKNGNLEITAQILALLKNNVFNVFEDKNIKPIERIMISYRLINYLVVNAFSEIYIFKNLLVPFLFEIAIKKKENFQIFWDLVFMMLPSDKDKSKFVDSFMDNITTIIEAFALEGEDGMSEWKMLILLFKEVLKIDKIAIIWLCLQSAPQHLKSVFNSNCIHQGDYFEYIAGKYDLYNANIMLSQVIKELNSQEKIKPSYEVEHAYANELSNVIELFLIDRRVFQDNKKLKDVLNEIIKQGFNHGNLNDYFSSLDKEQYVNREESIFYKNICYNLINLLNKVYLNIQFNKISTEPWFNRKNNDSIYYDEVGIGGTISQVTCEYIHLIDPKLITKSSDDFTDYFHKVIKVCSDLLLNSILKNFDSNRREFKRSKISLIIIGEHGSKKLDASIKKHFYLFSLNTQEIFYEFSFYIIKYLIWLKAQNPYIIYFIPIFFAELPFHLFYTLYKLSSPILSNEEMRKKINNKSIHFKDDDYIRSIINFYLFLFSNEMICNPEIKSSLSHKAKLFTKKKLVIEMQKDTLSFDYLIKGLINNMKSVSLSQDACKILIKIIDPICFGSNSMGKETIFISKLNSYFKSNNNLLKDFLSYYFNLLNQEMTKFIQGASEKIDNQSLSNEHLLALLLNTSISYNFMSVLLKINEFFLLFYPDEFFDLSLYSLYFLSMLKNISTRILAKPYISNIQKISNKIKEINNESSNKILSQKNNNMNLLTFALPIIGIFTKISNAKECKYYQTFMNKIEDSSELVIDSFIEFNSLLNLDELSNEMKIKIEEYLKFLEKIKEKKSKRKILSQEEIDKLSEEDKICLLCCNNINDTLLLPCKHKACGECVMQYLAEKDTCFICLAKIQKTQKVEASK